MKTIVLKLAEAAESVVAMALLLSAAALFFGGFLILGFQCYVWLRYGHWMPISVIDGASIIEVSWGWLYSPTDFVGLHKIVASIPASMAVSASAIIPAFVYGLWAETSPSFTR